jgi:oxalate decarboxylase
MGLYALRDCPDHGVESRRNHLHRRVGKGDLWFFPAGYPHSIQGLGPDGCEFLLVFNEGSFSEENTFLLSEWVAHTPPEILKKNLRLDQNAIDKLPTLELSISPANMPRSLSEDRAAAGGPGVLSPVNLHLQDPGDGANKDHVGR